MAVLHLGSSTWASLRRPQRTAKVSCTVHGGARCALRRQAGARRRKGGGAARRCVNRGSSNDESSVSAEEPGSLTTTEEKLEEVVEEKGLEVGLWKVISSDEDVLTTEKKVDKAGDLLKKYGIAYIITSVSLALVSFSMCYALVSVGVDVGGLLAKLGITVSGTSQNVGKIAIAYAAHKAASPIRFPPTVALTPVVAKLLRSRKEKADGGKEEDTT